MTFRGFQITLRLFLLQSLVFASLHAFSQKHGNTVLSSFSPLKPTSQAFFTAPDTVCAKMPVDIINGSVATTTDWTFCTANTYNAPSGQNFGNSGNKLSRPKFITLVKDSGIYYTFITSAGNRSVIRIINGTSLMNPPVSAFPVFISGIPSNKMRGIQIKFDSLSNQWIGFFSSGNALTRMIFTGGLSKTPSIVDIPFPGVSSSGLILVKEGLRWFGFAVDSTNNSISRLKFDSSLLKFPVVEQLGNIGSLNGPTGLCHVRENGLNHIFVCNTGNSTLTRLDFGNSLSQTPDGVNLGNIGGNLDKNVGISIIADCQHINGIICNWSTSANSIVQLNFPNGLSGPVTASQHSVGDPNRPYGVSELVRIADTVFAFYVNESNSTLAQLNFPPGSASIPSASSQSQPGPIVYNNAGDYNIILRNDQGSGNASTYCKPIHVLPELTVSIGRDTTVCRGVSYELNPGDGYHTYLWSTGDTSNHIIVKDSAKYWVRVTNKYGCVASDTVFVHVNPPPKFTLDTTICFGDRYWAQGKYQTQSGLYTDTLSSPEGCDSILFTNLTVKPEIIVNIGNDTVLCPGDTYVLDATTPGATAYLWQDGSTVPQYTAAQPGVYWAHVTFDGCVGADTVTIKSCPYKLVFPTAFTPNNDGVNDFFQPVGISIANFHMEIFDRWGALMFSTDDISQGWNGTWKNSYSPAGVYIFEATFEALSEPGTTLKEKGTFTLIR